MIKTIAHNFAQYFVSDMNYSSNGLGYIRNYVCKNLAQRGQNYFFMDILNHRVKPRFLEEDEAFIQELKYCGKSILESLSEGYHFSNFNKIMQNAEMEIVFDIQSKEKIIFEGNKNSEPFYRVRLEVVVSIVDENQRIYKNCCRNFALL